MIAPRIKFGVLTVIFAFLGGTLWMAPANAHCGRCGVGGAKQAAEKPAKCPQCTASKMCKKCLAKKLHAHGHAWATIQEAVCVIMPTAGNNAQGTVRFINQAVGVKIVADISGLSPNGTHAIHVHTYGDCTSSDGKSAGGHYNPAGVAHALPASDVRHAGDLGNLKADTQGHAHYELTVDNLSILRFHNPVLGRAVIIHAKADDGGQPTGNAGARIGHGVIGIANVPANATPEK